MPIPIYKKTIFDVMENKDDENAAKFDSIDRQAVENLMVQFIQNKDARGQWKIPRKEGLELLVYFRKYIDPNVRDNIFGCGGCAKKMVEYMFTIYKKWQNQTK